MDAIRAASKVRISTLPSAVLATNPNCEGFQ